MKKLILLAVIAFGLYGMTNSQPIEYFYRHSSAISNFDTVSNWSNYFNLADDVTTTRKKTLKSGNLGWQHEEIRLNYKNIPIEYSLIKIHRLNGSIKSINGEYYKNIDINTEPTISEKQALERALSEINADLYIWQSNEDKWLSIIGEEDLKSSPEGELVICQNYLNKNDENLHLAYKFDIYALKPLSRDYVYVDAHNGEIIHINAIIKDVNGTADTRYAGTRTISTQAHSGQYRLRDNSRGNGVETYDMNNGTSYSNAVDFTDNDNNWTASEYHNSDKDDAALDAHWGGMMTYDYFYQIHNRNSFDNSGTAIKNYVHYSSNYENAFWNGSVMTYGDGNTNFDALTSLDVVAHEIGHGVCTHTADLVYQDESGALNESMSDIWAACVENFADPTMDIWLIGENIDLRSGHVALRSMSNPKSEGQPDTYKGTNWYSGSGDHGGVHTNNGVSNFWFYLLSDGGSGTNDDGDSYNVNGIGVQDAELIVYRALTVYMTSNTNYSQARQHTIQAAKDLFGDCSFEVVNTTNAWYAVGVGDEYSIPWNLYISNTITSGTVETYTAVNKIEADNVIEPNTDVEYRAGNKIVLKPGFHAKAGSHFHAYIEDCQGLSENTKKKSYSSNKQLKSTAQNDSINNNDSYFVNNEINVYPNPTNDNININANISSDKLLINIYNLDGSRVYSQTTFSKNITIDLSNFNPGIYLLKIYSEEKNHLTKIIKK